jgi:hypothetical protein
MIKLIKADRRVSESELTVLGGIAQQIDAWSEFKKQCLKEFSWEPFA